ncbi:MAG: bifunctional non-ous end joining protein LigD [Miltoncostaeaceae bacterium]|jgi:bifunctional non-homologous end joining protein LigD|nr:bifunctional non-ous end joining protein LigD [Miltoncostaeaceae bacterium]
MPRARPPRPEAVEVPRPGKVLFPDAGLTKADLARHYRDVAAAALPHLRARPLNLQRFPDGIGGEGFLQQQAGRHFPPWIRRVRVPKAGGSVEHAIADDAATLVYLAGQAAIALHAWTSRADRLDRPDRLIFDLDPSREDFDAVRAAALALGALLRDLGLEPFALVTGSRGVHVVTPIQRRQDHDAALAFAREVAEVMVARHPEALTLEARKAKRGDRILVDVMRNAYAHTAVAPYSVRPLPGAPVAAPIPWEELEDPALTPRRYRMGALPASLLADGGPWRDLPGAARPLGAARRRLAALRTEAAVR